jgi:hypothetical protein
MKTKENKGKIFSVRFIKKDGTVRFMKCRTGVIAKLKGGELKYDATAKGLKVVFDLTCNAYRMINENSVYELTIKGKTYLGENAKQILSTL